MSDILAHLNLVTDRTSRDVALKNEKGTYNAADMNRVNAAVDILRDVFREHGYSVGEVELREWVVNELPHISDVENYLAAVRALDGKFRYSAAMIELPKTMIGLTYTGANDIEKFLAAMPDVFERMKAAWYYSDEIYAGEA